MIAPATPQLTAPPIGQRITVYEFADPGCLPHSTGVLIKTKPMPRGETVWILHDAETCSTWPVLSSDIRRIKYHPADQPCKAE